MKKFKELIKKLLGWEIFFSFHLTRGMGFFQKYIDIGKYLFYLVVGVALIPQLALLKGYEIAIIAVMVFVFFVTSFLLDKVAYSQRRIEYDNKRNPTLQKLLKK